MTTGLVGISYAGMRCKVNSRSGWLHRRGANAGLMVLAAALCLLTSGCMKSLKAHSNALAAATAPVIEQAAAAYQAANAIHEKRMDFDAVPAFEKDHSIVKLREIHPLITDEDLEVRLKVLTAFQMYTKTLVEISSGTESPELDAAAKSLGGSLAGLGNAAIPPVESALGIPAPSTTTETTVVTTVGATTTTTSTTTPTPDQPISTATQNLIITGANALGQFLKYRAIRNDLPKLIKDLDQPVISLCKTMIGEIDAMSDAEKIDFNYMLSEENQFLMNPGIMRSEVERRNEIAKMQMLDREQHAAEVQLAGLRAAIFKLALTHHALATDVAGANPESMTDKLKELLAAGQGLGKFYSSLPTS